MEDIKDFLLTNEEITIAKNQKKSSSKTAEYTYSVETSTDTDIVIKKVSKTGRSTSKLVLLISENQYYVLSSNGNAKSLTVRNLREFFRQYPGDEFHTGNPVWDVFHLSTPPYQDMEQAILFMAQNKAFYTQRENSFVPLSCCWRIVRREQYTADSAYSRREKIEKVLSIFNSEIAHYVVQKVMEKEEKSKNNVLQEFFKEKTLCNLYMEKNVYEWKYNIGQMECFYDIWRIWPAAATKFVDSWVASNDYSLCSDCIAHVIFAQYTNDIFRSFATYQKIDRYACKSEELAYPFNQEPDKFIDFLFEESKKYYMNDRLIKWCELWCQDLNMQMGLYNKIVTPYPNNLPIHVLKLHQMYRSKTIEAEAE